MKIQFETIACPICESDKHKLKFKAPDRFNVDAGDIYQIVSCTNCGFVYLNPRPKVESIAAFYENSDYQPFLSTQKSLNIWDKIYRWIRTYSVRSKRHKIEKMQPRGRLLDIGCGTGEFLQEMQRSGWQVEGIEKDQNAADFAKTTYQLPVSTNEFVTNNYLEKSFDVITLWHVLEHLYDPMETLKKAREILKDDGVMLIAVPNISSYDARFYRQNWVALDAPRHLYHFYPERLGELCAAAGLELVKMQQLTLDAFFNCLMSELLILAKTPNKKVALPVYLFRAGTVAILSIIKSSRLRTMNKRLGSSILYFIQKRRDAK